MRKRILFIFVILFLTASVFTAYRIHKNKLSSSLILYGNYDENKVLHNWLYNFETSETSEVGHGLGTKGWSPTAENILFYTLSHDQIEFWISNSNGENLHKIFDYRDYPELEINKFEWLTEDLLLLNIEKESFRSVATLDIKSGKITEIPNSTDFIRLATNENFWFESDRNGQLSVVNLDGTRTILPMYHGEQYFSPDGSQMAYLCKNDTDDISVCIATISIDGIENEISIAQIETPFPGIWWSPDGKLIGVQVLSSTKEKYFRVIDIQTGKTICEWLYPSKTNYAFWSPDGEYFIDSAGILLDISSGQISNIIVNESNPGHLIDWARITD